MSIISESEGVATMTINHYERILRERDEARAECKFLWDERDQARGELSLKQQTLTIAEGTLSDLRKQRDEWAAMCGRYKQERDIAEQDATNYHARIIELIAERDKTKQERDEAREDLEFRRGLYRVQEEYLETARRERDKARELLKKALVRGDFALAETKKAKENLFWSDHQDKREIQRELDEARGKCASWVREWRKLRVLCKQLDEDANDRLKERDEAREQNAKLLSIAERAIDDLRWFYENKADGVILELEQLKKETK
jgi:hypothetical protein